jgi:hypothetical protein
MVVSFERERDYVILWIIGDPEERKPFRLDLVTELKRRHLDLGTFARQCFRYEIEIDAPLRFFELLRYCS